MSAVGLNTGHIEQHLDETGLCQCPCADCTTRTSHQCVCLTCRCEYASDHFAPDGADE